MVVWCAQNPPRRQQFHVAPGMPVDIILKKKKETRSKNPVTRVESRASAVSLLESGE